MGTIANTIFQTLLGWVRTLTAEIWHMATTKSDTILGWIGSNWLGAAMVLCAVGVAVDLTVYLFRWQPYRVWKSFFARIRHREEEDTNETMPGAYESDELNDRTFSSHTALDPVGTDHQDATAVTWNAEEPPQEDWLEDDDGWERIESEGTTPSFEQAILPRRRRISRLFEESGDAGYTKPNELIDRYAAYRRPVYPRGWKAEQSEEEYHEDRRK